MNTRGALTDGPSNPARKRRRPLIDYASMDNPGKENISPETEHKIQINTQNTVEKRKKSITFYADSIRKAKEVAKNGLLSVAAEECSDVFSKQEASIRIDRTHSTSVLKLYIAYTYLSPVIDPTSSLWEVLRVVEESEVLSAVVQEPWLITQSLFILTQTPHSQKQVNDIIEKILQCCTLICE